MKKDYILLLIFIVTLLIIFFSKRKKIEEVAEEVVTTVQTSAKKILFSMFKEKYRKTIIKIFNDIGIEKELQGTFLDRVVAVIITESSGKEKAVGSSGEVGLMQIMSKTLDLLKKKYVIIKDIKFTDLFDIEKNILVGSLLLYDNYKQSKRNLDLATQRYNSHTAWLSKEGSEPGKIYLKKVKSLLT